MSTSISSNGHCVYVIDQDIDDNCAKILVFFITLLSIYDSSDRDIIFRRRDVTRHLSRDRSTKSDIERDEVRIILAGESEFVIV